MGLKDIIRGVLTFLHLDITKNLQYDRLTTKILKNILKPSSNCIDIGCHKGEILEVMIGLAPNGTHFAFEPIPSMYADLQKKFGSKATIFPVALSDVSGSTTFQHVTNAPAYSGINLRAYAISNPAVQEIQVEVKTLDELIPSDTRIDLIKIDVEGGEFNVLKGALQTLKENKPVVIFECGLGASDYYGTDPGEMYELLCEEVGMRISTLKSFVNGTQPLSKDEFVHCYHQKDEYYFVASTR